MRNTNSTRAACNPSVRVKNRGQAALELAIAVPFLAILLLAAGDVTRCYFFLMEVKNAAKAGAQYGAQNSTTAADLAGMLLKLLQNPLVRGFVRSAMESQFRKRFSV